MIRHGTGIGASLSKGSAAVEINQCRWRSLKRLQTDRMLNFIIKRVITAAAAEHMISPRGQCVRELGATSRRLEG